MSILLLSFDNGINVSSIRACLGLVLRSTSIYPAWLCSIYLSLVSMCLLLQVLACHLVYVEETFY
ncbi:hypothetical protein HAT2_00694 [Candidatus Similichlamydia laticola]|uniref:Uncharacterized protein n=1 Tax=Candidatus Similichlamydia laticola TaxID=2170265 RepID=A0A369KHH6_9BACT|nr:hypothetical protein HAT2_00694 [Candidatus Similichlamydia laticola]